MINKRKFYFTCLILFISLFLSSTSHSQVMSDYTVYPPFVAEFADPNVMIMLDNSGSMKNIMYTQSGVSWSSGIHTNFTPSKTYYGMFDSAKSYEYKISIPVNTAAYNVSIDPSVSGAFIESNCTPAAGDITCWDGNFLNWIVTRRIDATRMVLVGGKLESRTAYNYSGYGNYKILGNNERSDRTVKKQYVSSDSYSPIPDNMLLSMTSPADAGTVMSQYDPYAKLMVGGGGTSGYIYDSGTNIIGEFGVASTNQNWITVPFTTTYTNPVVVAKPPSYAGNQASVVRIQNVTATSFQIKVQEWNYLDGSHATETISYIVMEEGHHNLAGGMDIEAGTKATSDIYAVGCSINSTGSTSASFSSNFGSTPVVITSVMTYNGSDAVNSRAWNINSTGFTFAMQEEENLGGHASETISYIAASSGSLDAGDFMIEVTNNLGHTHNWNVDSFSSSFSLSPAMLAAMQTKNDNNPASIRYKDISANSVNMMIQEEQSCDAEVIHANEDIGYIALQGSSNAFNIALVVSDEPTGLIHDIADEVRLGISFYRYDPNKADIYNGSTIQGGTLKFYIPINPFVKKPSANGGYRLIEGYIGMTIAEAVDSIEHFPLVWGTTPIAENLWEVIQYFEQDSPYYDASAFDLATPANPERDPYYFPQYMKTIGCCQSNVIIFTDGFPYKDADIPASIVDYDNDGKSGDCSSTDPNAQCQDNLDDVALWSYWNLSNNEFRDLRPADLDDSQFLRIYTVGFADGTIRPILQDTADNADGEAYAAEDGLTLASALLDVFSKILSRSSSGTAASLVSNTGQGEGAVYQAYFLPKKMEGIEERRWLGYLNALFKDKFGNIREDTNGNDTLDVSSDLVLRMDYSPEEGTLVYKCTPVDEGETVTCPPISNWVNMDDIIPMWNGGQLLWDRADPRKIFTAVPSDGINIANGHSYLPFITTNWNALQPHLRAADQTEAENIIQWIDGDDRAGLTDTGHPDGYRERGVTINGITNTWKLGDIIHSTPTVVGEPMEDYDLRYNDSTYTEFRQAHINRRQIVYAGANDGMLHAFNAGCFDADYFSYSDVCGGTSSGLRLGDEMWGFIPHGLLPHLKWLTVPDYTHVEYVNLKPKVTDIQIFSTDADHVKGWGTVLIGGFRLGGKDISWTSGGNNLSASPEYFALDITNPELDRVIGPRLLWTFSHPDLGFSTSYPAIARIGTKWFMVIGSGATDYDSSSNIITYQAGNIFVLDISSGSNGAITTWTEGSNYWKIPTGNATTFMADPVSADINIDGNVDVIYLSENYNNGTGWNSLVRRITTGKGTVTNPSSWTLSTLSNVNTIAGVNDNSKLITSSPAPALDDRGNLWVYFGTGQFMGSLDKNQTDSGAMYGIKDKCWSGSCTTSYSNVLDISKAAVTVHGVVSGVSGSCAGATASWSDLLNTSKNCDGWAMYFQDVGESVDFFGETLQHSGERVISRPLVLGGLVSWATYRPGVDVCDAEGESNSYSVYATTGTANRKYVYDQQAEQVNPSEIVARTARLGEGLPSAPSAEITDDGSFKIFFQQSTGAILSIKGNSPKTLKSGVEGYTNKPIQ